jgi:Lon protease-like protein
MPPFLRGEERRDLRVPLFPLHTVLYPGGRLPLKVFEQRYIAMTKACIRDERPFGVCLLTRGDEVADPRQAACAPEFAAVGTLATIAGWDMPQLGIIHLATVGGARFQVRSHGVQDDGLAVGEVTTLPAEPAVALPEAHRALAQLLELIARRIGPQHLPEPPAFDDATWVGYRLAELLPLPLPIKQSMLEINDSEVRLAVLGKFLREQGLLPG